jgi:site-specific DNA-methyltransferase (adenine-specific)
MLTSVKGGASVGPSAVRDFAGVLEREKAEMGLFICLYQPTRAMGIEAVATGVADTVHGDLPKLQIVSIEEWFRGAMPLLPPLEHLPSAAVSRLNRRRSTAVRRPAANQPELPLSFIGGKGDPQITRHVNPQLIHTGTGGVRSVKA